MKSWAMTFLLFCLAARAAFGAAPSGFDEANQLYDRQQYQEAKAGYEKLVQAGASSANLSYNLGNAEFRLDQLGRAALQYERALLLDPAHREARANLDLLHTRESSRLLAESPLDRLVPPWPGPWASLAGALGGWLAVLGFVVLVVLRRWSSGLAWLALGLGSSLALWCGVVLWRVHLHGQVAIVLRDEVQARTAPADREAVLEELSAGSQVRVLGEHGDWVNCELPSAQRGWLPAASIEKLQPSSS